MKIQFLTIVMASVATITSVLAQDQEFKPSGSVYGKAFFNYHSEFTSDKIISQFELNRAYFGYKYNISKNFSTNVLLDVGKADITLPDSAKTKLSTSLPQTAYLKQASITYKNGRLTIDAGLIGLLQHKIAEGLWGHRYVYKEFQDNNKLTSTADLGIQAQYKVNDFLTLDYMVRNGEGYKDIGNNNNAFRSGGGFTIKAFDGFVFRGYYDVEATQAAQTSISHTIGYSTDLFTIGGEYSIQLNHGFVDDNTVGGFSGFGEYNITKQIQVFARYDYFNDNKNDSKNYSAIIGGVQYVPVKNLDIALNYQSKMWEQTGIDAQNVLYLNFQYAF